MISRTVTESWCVQEKKTKQKNNKKKKKKKKKKTTTKGITWKLRKGEQLFLCSTRRPDLIHIPIKLHEDIPNGYTVMWRPRIFMDGQTDGRMDSTMP